MKVLTSTLVFLPSYLRLTWKGNDCVTNFKISFEKVSNIFLFAFISRFYYLPCCTQPQPTFYNIFRSFQNQVCNHHHSIHHFEIYGGIFFLLMHISLNPPQLTSVPATSIVANFSSPLLGKHSSQVPMSNGQILLAKAITPSFVSKSTSFVLLW